MSNDVALQSRSGATRPAFANSDREGNLGKEGMTASGLPLPSRPRALEHTREACYVAWRDRRVARHSSETS